MLVIVWLFPVPGGPLRTKLNPLEASKIASVWLLSALKGIANLFGKSNESKSLAFVGSTSFLKTKVGSTKAWTISFLINSFLWFLKSFHIIKRVKLKIPIKAVSESINPSTPVILLLKVLKYFFKS